MVFGLFFEAATCIVEKMEASYLTRHPKLKDSLSFAVFVLLVLVGTLLINTFVFRSFSVSGHSMDNTLSDGDRLIVNRVPVTLSQLQNKPYVPERGQIIVFKNPRFTSGKQDEYIVKRVIAFPGERVTVNDGVLTIYTKDHPDGYQPDGGWTTEKSGPQQPTSGDVDVTVPEGVLFVAGDNRIDTNSYDSRTGLGYIPNYDVVGPVSLRVFPFTSVSVF